MEVQVGQVKSRVGAAKVSDSRVPVDGKTIADAFLRRVMLGYNEPVFLVKEEGHYVSKSWGQIYESVLALYAGLSEAGIQPGDRVCILSQSRLEWAIADLANLASGFVTVPIYQSNSVEDVAYILDNCEAKLVYVEDENQYEKLTAALKISQQKVQTILFSEPKAGSEVHSFQTWSSRRVSADVEEQFRSATQRITSESLATIVYTSGTTGQPKGAMLTHGNLCAELRSIIHEVVLHREDVTLTFLPFAHILGRVESLLPIFAGFRVAFAESINSITQNLVELHPTLLVSVPRIYEKVYAKIQADVQSSQGLKKHFFKWAVAVGRSVARHRSDRLPISLSLMAKFKIADQVVFSKVREKLGGRIRFTISGGAPLSRDLCEFFHACGIKILEGYGLTETTAAITVNRPDDYRFGTVGKPLANTEFRFAEDGEIQVRGPAIFKGYYHNEQATQEAFTKDGWFCTGDIGEIDDRGFLKITDRKKELIVTSGGKKVAPQKLENLLKTCRFVSNVMVYGDQQKYLVALITLSEPDVKKWAKSEDIAASDFSEVVSHAKLQEIMDGELKAVNSQLASFESVKKIKILPHDWTVETGELTPSLKVKRKIVTQKFKNEIDSLYR